MDETMRKFSESRELAVVGVSSSKTKFGRSVYRALKQRGIKTFPVNPGMTECDGAACFPSLRSLPKKLDAAVVVVRPEHAREVVEDAAAAGIKRLWFQQGADFSDSVAAAQERGIETVTDRCILMYAGEVTGIHRFHRFVWRLFGKY